MASQDTDLELNVSRSVDYRRCLSEALTRSSSILNQSNVCRPMDIVCVVMLQVMFSLFGTKLEKMDDRFEASYIIQVLFELLDSKFLTSLDSDEREFLDALLKCRLTLRTQTTQSVHEPNLLHIEYLRPYSSILQALYVVDVDEEVWCCFLGIGFALEHLNSGSEIHLSSIPDHLKQKVPDYIYYPSLTHLGPYVDLRIPSDFGTPKRVFKKIQLFPKFRS